MTRAKNIAVVILNWNGAKYLKRFLPSVISNSPEADVIVIDNSSSDESVELLKSEFENVQTIVLDKNYGFAEGYNKGLQDLDYEYFVLLNSDVDVPKNWLSPQIAYLNSDPKLVACAPLILSYAEQDYFEYAGAAGGYLDRDGFAFCAGRIFYAFEKNTGQYNTNREVFWASGAALTIKSSAWKEVNGFDGTFFAHMEEIDLCWRLKNRGYKIGVCGEAKVYHIGGGTLDRQSSFKTYLNFRNNLFLLLKNHRSSALLPFILRRMILDGIAGIRFLTEGNFAYFFAVLKAHFHFYSKFFYYIKLRNTEKKFWKTPNLCGQYRGSILVSFFLKHKHNFQQLDSKLLSE
ncbi:MAG: glycosyltransferase family 2 protein [Flavobacteriales bacterium]|jgi:GT2 family glycosyltransferase|nr:glycosyltransferase family 2 protein [Flavobacteriales bacterium]MDP4817669.1 glycosyltransferase family 2 protein [Flavobacteriales bacterium]